LLKAFNIYIKKCYHTDFKVVAEIYFLHLIFCKERSASSFSFITCVCVPYIILYCKLDRLKRAYFTAKSEIRYFNIKLTRNILEVSEIIPIFAA